MARRKGMGSLQQEKNGYWTVRFCINGERRSRSAGTTNRQVAEKLLQRILAQFGRGENRLPLADAWHYYEVSPIRRELADCTLNSKQQIWNSFSRWTNKWHPEMTQLAHVTADAIGEYLLELRRGHTAGTYNNRVCVLREIFHVLQDRAGIIDDPWNGIQLRANDSHSRRELSLEEIRSLLASALRVSPNWQKLIYIGLYTGLRLGDCCKLRWSEVLLDENIIQTIPSKTRKYAHGRPITIPLHPKLRTVLTVGNVSDAVYVLPEIAQLYQDARWRVCEELAKIFRSAGIKMQTKIEGRKRLATEASFHSLRHTFVSLSANAGVPLSVIASIVGHTSTAMTRHYYHENAEALRKAVATIPEL